MIGYLCPLTCPNCAGPLHHVNGTASGSQAVAVARCEPCRQEWVVTVTLRPVRTPEQDDARRRKALSRASSPARV